MICFMLTMQIVICDGITSDLSKFINNQPAGLNVYSHNMHYSPHETQIVN
jgi:hypothetical protein